MTKKDVKEFWERNKTKILIGGGTIIVVSLAGLSWLKCKKLGDPSDVIEGYGGGLTFFRNKPSRAIPETELFKILDIAEDAKDGCVTWLDGCKLSDCGKLGEGLSKIERVDPDMFVTLAILGRDKNDHI